MGPIDNCWRGLTLRILKHVDHLSTWESRHVRRPRMTTTDLNTWIAGSHGFAYSSMRATGNPSAAILLQSKHWIDTLTYEHVSAWNATGDRFLASYFMKILKKTRLGVPSIAGRLLKVIETCVYDLSLQTHTPLHYILGLSSQTLTPAKRWQNFEIWSRGTSCSNRCLWSLSNSTRFKKNS